VFIPPESVEIHLGEGTALLRATNLAIRDFHDVPNNFLHGPSQPATVSFGVRWSGPTRRQHISDSTGGFAGDFIENRATLEWSARAIGFEFTSDPGDTSRSFGGPFGASGAVLFAEIGHERNGIFFGR
jgi:hypothetical protein